MAVRGLHGFNLRLQIGEHSGHPHHGPQNTRHAVGRFFEVYAIRGLNVCVFLSSGPSLLAYTIPLRSTLNRLQKMRVFPCITQSV